MWGPSRPDPDPPAPPPIIIPAPVSPESNQIVSGDPKRRRAMARAAGRRGTILTGSRGVLGEANVGKTLLGN